jgi:ABC-type Zn uptake system ZnuABC Zn-binding protein ZnuA
VDRVFIQTYNDANFNQELDYAEKYAGVAISDKQLSRLKELINNTKIKSVLVFPSSGKPEETAALVKKLTPMSN